MVIGSLWNIILLLRTTSVKRLTRQICDCVFITMSGFFANSVWNFLAKKCVHNCFVSLFPEAPLAGISVKNYLVLFALGDIFCRCVWNPLLGGLQEGRHLGHQEGSFGGHWHGDRHLCIMITHPPPPHHKHHSHH